MGDRAGKPSGAVSFCRALGVRQDQGRPVRTAFGDERSAHADRTCLWLAAGVRWSQCTPQTRQRKVIVFSARRAHDPKAGQIRAHWTSLSHPGPGQGGSVGRARSPRALWTPAFRRPVQGVRQVLAHPVDRLSSKRGGRGQRTSKCHAFEARERAEEPQMSNFQDSGVGDPET